MYRASARHAALVQRNTIDACGTDTLRTLKRLQVQTFRRRPESAHRQMRPEGSVLLRQAAGGKTLLDFLMEEVQLGATRFYSEPQHAGGGWRGKYANGVERQKEDRRRERLAQRGRQVRLGRRGHIAKESQREMQMIRTHPAHASLKGGLAKPRRKSGCHRCDGLARTLVKIHRKEEALHGRVAWVTQATSVT
jgi:hypothetical protein